MSHRRVGPGRLRSDKRRAVRVRGPAGGWRPYLLTMIGLVLIWMALWGSYSLIVILLGVAVSALILLLFPLPTMDFRFGLHPWRMVVLLATFLWDVVVASVQVGWLAIRPRLPQPEVTTVQLESDSDLLEALTALAVSLVPGSLIVDADSHDRTLTIHVLDAERQADDRLRRSGAGSGAADPAGAGRRRLTVARSGPSLAAGTRPKPTAQQGGRR